VVSKLLAERILIAVTPVEIIAICPPPVVAADVGGQVAPAVPTIPTM
jgi:hypothetical protein